MFSLETMDRCVSSFEWVYLTIYGNTPTCSWLVIIFPSKLAIRAIHFHILRPPAIPYCLNKPFVAGRELESAMQGAEDRGGRIHRPRGSFGHVLAMLSRLSRRWQASKKAAVITWRAATAAEGRPWKISERPCRAIATVHADKLRVTQLLPNKNYVLGAGI